LPPAPISVTAKSPLPPPPKKFVDQPAPQRGEGRKTTHRPVVLALAAAVILLFLGSGVGLTIYCLSAAKRGQPAPPGPDSVVNNIQEKEKTEPHRKRWKPPPDQTPDDEKVVRGAARSGPSDEVEAGSARKLPTAPTDWI